MRDESLESRFFSNSGLGRSKKIPSVTLDVFSALSCGGMDGIRVRFEILDFFCFMFSDRKQKSVFVF